MTRTLPFFALALALAGCEPEPFSDCRTADGHDFEIVAVDTAAAAAFIEGDTLSVQVEYGGGCEEHAFVVCWPDGTFAESAPVQASLELWHGGLVDGCEALLNETLELDLTPLKEAWHTSYGEGAGTISVNLAGASEPLVYSFE
ncbi:MAG: hypothetical protein Q8P18_05635 [Pseudomonadota bacterium]|nr:hypothetical protein [Pseudomonadota bacterium]